MWRVSGSIRLAHYRVDNAPLQTGGPLGRKALDKLQRVLVEVISELDDVWDGGTDAADKPAVRPYPTGKRGLVTRP